MGRGKGLLGQFKLDNESGESKEMPQTGNFFFVFVFDDANL